MATTVKEKVSVITLPLGEALSRWLVPTGVTGLRALYSQEQGLIQLQWAFDDHAVPEAFEHSLAAIPALQALADFWQCYQAGNLSEANPDKLLQQVSVVGTPFQQAVWRLTASIPPGKTQSYQQLAQALERPKAYRAVAQALRRNPLLLLIPCHRVVGSRGELTGYMGRDTGHVALKQALLDFEANYALPLEIEAGSGYKKSSRGISAVGSASQWH